MPPASGDSAEVGTPRPLPGRGHAANHGHQQCPGFRDDFGHPANQSVHGHDRTDRPPAGSRRRQLHQHPHALSNFRHADPPRHGTGLRAFPRAGLAAQLPVVVRRRLFQPQRDRHPPRHHVFLANRRGLRAHRRHALRQPRPRRGRQRQRFRRRVCGRGSPAQIFLRTHAPLRPLHRRGAGLVRQRCLCRRLLLRGRQPRRRLQSRHGRLGRQQRPDSQSLHPPRQHQRTGRRVRVHQCRPGLQAD